MNIVISKQGFLLNKIATPISEKCSVGKSSLAKYLQLPLLDETVSPSRIEDMTSPSENRIALSQSSGQLSASGGELWEYASEEEDSLLLDRLWSQTIKIF